eukprot:15465913-Alexandrium_andersonii.AAC.1
MLKTGKYKKADAKNKGAGIKLVKAALTQKAEDKEKFTACHSEAVHLRAGGRSRINNYKESVVSTSERVSDLLAPKVQFWCLEDYKAEFGDPKANKAKVVKREVLLPSGKLKMEKGCYVTVGRPGAYE